MKKFLLVIAIFLTTLTLTSCFTSFNDVEWIEFVNSFDAVYRKDSTIDLSQITVKVKYTNGTEEVLNASNSAIVVTGIDTSSEGIKTAKVTYRSISISAQYEVIPATDYLSNVDGLAAELVSGTKEKVVIEGEFVGNFTIVRPIQIVGVNGATIKGTITISPDATQGTVAFKNIKIVAPTVGSGYGIIAKKFKNRITVSIDSCEINGFDTGFLNNELSGEKIKKLEEHPIESLIIKDTFFNNNTYKGMYVEGAKNVSITGTTFNSNATTGPSSSATRIACDINLKWATYNSVLIENCRFVNNGANPDWSGQYVNDGYTVTPYTAALAIKARNDAGDYNATETRDAAVLNNVIIRNNRFENNFNAIYFGEPKSADIYNDDDSKIETKQPIPGVNELINVTLTGNTFFNNSQADIINCTTNTTIRSVVNSIEGLNNAILYSSLAENVTIVLKNDLTANIGSYKGHLVRFENGKYYSDGLRTFSNISFVNE